MITKKSFKEKVIQRLNLNNLIILDINEIKIARLELIIFEDLKDDDLIEKITLWREINKSCFLTEFEATFDRTKNWIQTAIINNPNRLLFKIYSLENELIGHIGAILHNDYLEYDYYILGKKIPIKDFAITIAKRFLLWLLKIVPGMLVLGNVRSDNSHALDFHLRTGFKIVKKSPLKRHINENNEVYFKEIKLKDTKADIFLIEINAYEKDLQF